VAKALSHLHSLLDRHPGSDAALPTMSRLADGAGVSRATMAKAVSLLKAQGELTAIRGGRIRKAGTAQPVAARAAVPPVAWRAVRDGLLRELAQGRVPPGKPLPDPDRLARRYGVSRPTLRKALAALAASGDVEREGRRWRAPALGYHTGFRYASVTLAAAAGAKGEYGVFSDRGRAFLESLESACNAAGIGLRVLRAGPGRLQPLLKALRGDSGLGFVFWPGEWPGRPQGLAECREILGALSAARRPIAVFDEMGGFPMPGSTRGGAPMRAFTIGAARAGRAVGEALLRAGHRKAAYLTPYRGLGWSDRRLQGLAQAFAGAGLEDAVVPFGLGLGRKYNKVAPSGRIEARPGGPEEALFARMLRRILGPDAASGPIWAGMRARILPALMAQARFELLDHWFEEEIEAAMQPSFRTALAEPGVTAWIGANDATALAALRFLRREGLRVPIEVSVAGFDDTVASFEEGLTTYNFGIAGFPQAMLRFLLEPGRFPRAGAEEIDGVVIHRRTTAASGRRQPGAAEGRGPGAPRRR
jgi:DNA-binding LacI/PurR family transcriptional regulator/DNA-binding transcriptional regulator YhcF (GntR family)